MLVLSCSSWNQAGRDASGMTPLDHVGENLKLLPETN